MKRVTKKDNFKAVREVLVELGDKKELVEFIDREIALIEKKSASKKLTSNQKNNEHIKEKMLEVMGTLDKAVTITELMGADPELAEAVGNSNQKLSALMTQLKNAKIVDRIQEGKKATFRVA